MQNMQMSLKTAITTFVVAVFISNPLIGNNLELPKNSPFLPHNYGVKKVATRPQPVGGNGLISRQIEFRGIIELGGSYRFSLHNKKENKGYWVSENEGSNGIKAINYNPQSMSLTLSMNGTIEQLTLISANESPLPVAVSAPPNKGASPPGPATLAAPKPQTTNKARVVPRRRVILPKKN